MQEIARFDAHDAQEAASAVMEQTGSDEEQSEGPGASLDISLNIPEDDIPEVTPWTREGTGILFGEMEVEMRDQNVHLIGVVHRWRDKCRATNTTTHAYKQTYKVVVIMACRPLKYFISIRGARS